MKFFMRPFWGDSKRSRDRRSLAGVLVAIVVTGYWLLSLHPVPEPLGIDGSFRKFFSLYALYQQEGLEKYLDGKEELKAQIKKSLESTLTEEEEIFVVNVALYLFPDILPEENFEKAVAMEQWAPLQEAIEKKPHTPESRLWFEEMRANIWNYENPDSSRISSFAREILKIYNDLSSQ